MQPSSPARKRLAAGLAVAAVAALGTLGVLVASDHQDSPNVELNPLQDLTDVYAFPSPTAGRIVLVMNTRAFLTPAAAPTASFDTAHHNPLRALPDVSAFPSPTAGRIVLVMNTRAFLTPAAAPTASFDHNQLYQFKIDNTGDAREDKVIQVTFSGSGASQTVQVRGPVAPPVPGAMANTVSTIEPAVTGAIKTNLGGAPGGQG